MSETTIFVPEIKMWCEKCHKCTLARSVVFGGHFVDVQCIECDCIQTYKMETDTVHAKNEQAQASKPEIVDERQWSSSVHGYCKVCADIREFVGDGEYVTENWKCKTCGTHPSTTKETPEAK